MATRVQVRGPITDYFGCGPRMAERFPGSWGTGSGRLALCRCVHGKEWPEGDYLEGHGGGACKECVRESVVES